MWWINLKKNFFTLQRQWRSTLLSLLCPGLMLVTLSIAAKLTELTPPATRDELSVHECIQLDPGGADLPRPPPGLPSCVTVLFAPVDNPFRQLVVERFSRANAVRVLSLQSEREAAERITSVPGVVLSAVIFQPSVSSIPSPIPGVTIPQPVRYNLWHNDTWSTLASRWSRPLDHLQRGFGVDGRLAGLQAAVDSAVFSVIAGTDAVELNLRFSFSELTPLLDVEVPHGSPDLVLYGGSIFMVIGATVTSIVLGSHMAEERRKGLFGALRMLGLRDSVYIGSYALVFALVLCISALFASIIGVTSFVPTLANTDLSVQFVVNFCVLFCTTCLVLFVYSILERERSVVVANLSISLVAVATTQIVIMTFGPLTLNRMFQPPTAAFALILYFMFPWVHYAKIFSDILRMTAPRKPIPGEPPPSFHLSWSDIYVRQRLPVGCVDHPDPFELQEACWASPSISDSLIMLTFAAIVYLLLAWYLGQVVSYQGASRKWNFCLSRKYWGFSVVEPIPPDADTIAHERHLSETNRSVRLHKLSKAYDKVTAVKEVSMELKPGEITALLGHNGAGKTSLVKVLTGQCDATHGRVFVLGYDVEQDIQLIRKHLGVCLQDNLLWDSLSAKQHLELICGLKGLDKALIEKHVGELLAEVDLTPHATELAGNFSGGMKRRLCLAMSLVGSPHVLVLDEPTTGMDPLTRRKVWDAIRRNLVNTKCCVLLTTHSMEEADVLGSEVAIMSNGHLRAKGTPLFLKTNFGSGWEIHLLTRGTRNTNAMTKAIERLLPEAEILTTSSGALTVTLPRKSVHRIPNLFRWIESQDSQVVAEWGVSSSTLEEVFLRLAAQDRVCNELIGSPSSERPTRQCLLCENTAELATLFTRDGREVRVPDAVCRRCAGLPAVPDDIEEKSDHDHEQSVEPSREEEATTQDDDMDLQDSNHTIVSWQTQVQAVLYKDWTLFTKQKKTHLTMVGFLLCTLTMNWYLLPAIPVDTRQYCPGGWEFTDNTPCNTSAIADRLLAQPVVVLPMVSVVCAQPDGRGGCLEQAVVPGWKRVGTVAGPYRFSACAPVPGEIGPPCSRNLDSGTPVSFGFIDSTTPGDDSLKEFDWGRGPGNQSLFTEAWFQSLEGITSVDQLTFESQLLVRKNATQVISGSRRDADGDWRGPWHGPCRTIDPLQRIRRGKTYQGPFRTFLLPAADAMSTYQSMFPDVGLLVKRLSIQNLTLHVEIERFAQQYSFPRIEDYNYDEFQYVSNAYLFNSTRDQIDIVEVCGWMIATGQYPAGWAQVLVNGLTTSLLRTAGINTTLSTGFVSLPRLTFRASPFTPFNLGLQLLLLSFVTLLYLPYITGHLLEEREEGLYQLMRIAGLRHVPYWIATSIFILAITTAWGMIYLIVGTGANMNAFRPERFGPMLLVLILGGYGQLGVTTFLSSILRRRAFATSLCYLLVVLVAASAFFLSWFFRGDWPIGFLLFPLTAYVWCLTLVVSGSTIGSTSMSTGLGMLFLSASLWLFVGLALRFLSLGSLCRPCTDSKRLHVDGDVPLLASSSVGSADEDVLQEKDRVIQTDAGKFGVAFVGLGKTFRGGGGVTRAVNDLTVGMDYGEVFGLLGPNGAGKTTSLNVLAGLIPPTDGEAIAAGFDLRTQLQNVYTVLGVCPQFSTLWNDLSVAEHLEFYLRLKGIRARSVNVQRLAESVGLDGDQFLMHAGQLSGGNKRRLAVAVSLVGSPKIWLLDEPTTGLDPETRRFVWEIIKKHRHPNRVVVLTTHSMEEADALCDRIGIMGHGALRCIGSSLHLKTRFGRGYKLVIHLSPDAQAGPVNEFLTTSFPNNHIKSLEGKGPLEHVYLLQAREEHRLSVADVFAAMAKITKLGVQEWGLTQSSLEDVFVSVASADFEEASVVGSVN